MQLLDGRKVANEVKDELSQRVENLLKKGITPHLSIIRIGEDPNSITYMKYKKQAAKSIGVEYSEYIFPEMVSEEELLNKIEELNHEDKITGIIVQFPLPNHIKKINVISKISPLKDVDGLNPENTSKLNLNLEGVRPCTPSGVIRLMEAYGIDAQGKEVVVLGRSRIVGAPMATMLKNAGAHVSVCHSRTQDISLFTKKADLIVSATGSPKLITGEIVKNDVIIFDVGITKKGKKIIGDVDFETVSPKASFITPNPGGVGPMTIAMLLNNVVELTEK